MEAVEQTIESMWAAHNARDWDRLRATIAEDFRLIDHRPAGFGTIAGREEFIEFLKSGIELVPDRRMAVTRWHTGGDDQPSASTGSSAASLFAEGTDQYGGSVEWELTSAWQVIDGRVTLFEAYPLESVNEAIERAGQLLKEGS
jgi:hypothetical protein